MKAFLFFVLVFCSTSCFSQATFAKAKQVNYTVKIFKDTVELDPGIHYIKVDGKVYEIKRSTTIQEAQEQVSNLKYMFPGFTPTTFDTTIIKGGDAVPAPYKVFRSQSYSVIPL